MVNSLAKISQKSFRLDTDSENLVKNEASIISFENV